MKKIIIFGAGNNLKKVLNHFKNNYEIVAIVDNNYNLWGKAFDDYLISNPEVIKEKEYEDIVIVSMYWREIGKQLFADFNIKAAYRYLFDLNSAKNEINLKRIELTPMYWGLNPRENGHYKDCEIRKKFNLNKKVLFLAYYFPPFGASSVQRTLKFVKHLSNLGYEIVVVTSDNKNNQYRDNSLVDDLPKNVSVYRIADNYKEKEELTISEKQEILDFLGEIDNSESFLNQLNLAQEEQELYIIPDRLIKWAVEVYKRISDFIDMDTIDVIYSTVPEWSPHLIAYLLKKRFGTKWIADYRDPWVADEDYVRAVYPQMKKEEIKCDQLLESTLITQMDAIIVAGENWKNLFVNRYAVEEKRLYTITNGFDEDDFPLLNKKNRRKNNQFTLCYNGSLGYNRKPSIVLCALNSLIEKRKIDKNNIVWEINGAITKDQQINEIDKYDKYNIVHTNGLLPHKDSVIKAVNADLLVLYGEKGTMARLNYPGKFFEYLRMGNQILCIADAGNPQEEVLRETYLGKTFTFEDSSGIEEFIYSQYSLWKENKSDFEIDTEKIQKYNRLELTKKLAAIIEDICIV